LSESAAARASAERTVEVIACTSCGGNDRDEAGRTLGERLCAELAVAAEGSAVRVTGMRCLWACAHRCAVHVRAPGRTGYVIGRLEPGGDAARGIIDYATAYGETADGAVPFKQWPQAVRGHFLCRIPSVPAGGPAGTEDEP
jgi:predicted metal-binding protein